MPVTIAGQVVCTDSRALARAARIQSADEAAVRRSSAFSSTIRCDRSACASPSTAEEATTMNRRRPLLQAQLGRGGFALCAPPRCGRCCGSTVPDAGGLGRLRRELGRSRPRHATWPTAAATGGAGTPCSRADARARSTRKPHQPHYQSRDYNPLNGGIERWFEPVTDEIGAHPTLRAILARLPRAVRPADAAGRPPPGMSRCTSSASRRGPARPASRRRRACTATASTTCWCCWSAAATSTSGETTIHDLARRAARQLHPDRAARRRPGRRHPGLSRRHPGRAARSGPAGLSRRAGGDVPALRFRAFTAGPALLDQRPASVHLLERKL